MEILTSLVDIENITPTAERSEFSEAALEKAANSILKIATIVNPIIVKRTGIETVEILDGNFQFWAAVVAVEKGICPAEALCFIVPSNMASAVVEQRKIFEEVQPKAEEKIPTDDKVLEKIVQLDEENGTDNYLPIFHYRAAFSHLSRKQQDEALYRLEASDRIKLSALQEVRSYTPEQINEGISQDVGGRLFFIVVEKPTNKPKPTNKSANPRIFPIDYNAIEFKPIVSRKHWTESFLKKEAEKYALSGGKLFPLTVKPSGYGRDGRGGFQKFTLIGDEMQNSKNFWIFIKATEMGLIENNGSSYLIYAHIEGYEEIEVFVNGTKIEKQKPNNKLEPVTTVRSPELVQLSNAIALDSYRAIQKALKPFKKQKAIRLNAPKQQLANWATEILIAAA